jgi:hypothetical protein
LGGDGSRAVRVRVVQQDAHDLRVAADDARVKRPDPADADDSDAHA